MRMNVQGDKTAADIVNSYTQNELEKILEVYGELDNARRLASLIVQARSASPILTTDDLGNAVAAALPSFAPHKVLAKIFQALRIEVNQEMRSLEKFLEGAAASLKSGGLMVVITYHSLEDRMVKNFFRTPPMKRLGSKPTVPSEEEISSNPRARSAKMRIAQKL